MTVIGMATVDVVDDPAEIKRVHSPRGKAFLRVRLEDGREFDITLNLAQMIGGAGKGASERFGYEK